MYACDVRPRRGGTLLIFSGFQWAVTVPAPLIVKEVTFLVDFWSTQNGEISPQNKEIVTVTTLLYWGTVRAFVSNPPSKGYMGNTHFTVILLI